MKTALVVRRDAERGSTYADACRDTVCQCAGVCYRSSRGSGSGVRFGCHANIGGVIIAVGSDIATITA